MDDSTSSVDFVIRFREFLGTYMEHCHNTQHEDHAMLLRWDVENPGQVRVMPTPMPTWDGVGYVPSYALPTFRSGDLDAAADGPPAEDPPAEDPPEEDPDTITINRAEYDVSLTSQISRAFLPARRHRICGPRWKARRQG